MTSRSATSTLPRRKPSAAHSPSSAANPVCCRPTGSSACRPKRSGNTPAGRGRRRPPRLAIGSAAGRQTSRGSRTTGPRMDRRSAGPPGSAVTPPIPGGCTTCTATRTSGAGIGTTRDCRAARTPTCTPRRTRPRKANTAISPVFAVAGAGPTTAGPAGRPSDCGSNPNGDTTTSAFALSPCSFETTWARK